MTSSQRLAAVRRCLDRWLETQTCSEDIEIRDSVLIRSGFYVGRRFQLGVYQAVWFMEEDEVKVHDANGTLVARFDSAAIDGSLRIASEPVIAIETDDEAASTIRMPQAKSEQESVRIDKENRRAA